jgi:cyanobactin biosynthesis protein (PatB/AcyB/McaB family)
VVQNGGLHLIKIELEVKLKMIPIQAQPVKRPDIIAPHLAVDVIHDVELPEDAIPPLSAIRFALLHGANYNDPASFQSRSYQQIKSSWGRGSVFK